MNATRHLGRRDLGKLVSGAGAVAALGAPAIVRAASSEPITFFSYATYTDPQLTGEFAKQTGTPLKI